MENTKIVRLLRTFSRKEIKDFEAFINSPAQMKRRDVSAAFNAIKKFYPDFNSPGLQDEKIFKKLFPGQRFDKPKYSAAAFHLFDAACEFLAALDSSSNKIEKGLSLMKQFIQRGMENAFSKMAKKIDSDITSSGMSLDNFFFYRYRYEDLMMIFHMRKGDSDKQFKSFLNKINLSTGLFLLRFLRGIPNIPIAQSVYNVELDTTLIDKISDSTKIDKIFADPDIHPYLKLLEVTYFFYKGMTDTDCEKWTRKTEDSLFRNLDLYDHDEKVFISRHLMNLYSTMIRDAENSQERERYGRMQLEMVKLSLQHGLFKNSKDPYMPNLYFRNVIFTALDIKKYEWADKFIKEYINEIKPSHRKNLMNYCLAMLEFDRGEFGKSLECLSTVKYESFYYKVDVKFLLMLLYYELELFEEAHYMLDTTRKYLKTTPDVTEHDRVVYTNFVGHYGQLLKLHDHPDKTSAQMELDKIMSNKVRVEYSDWLVKKFKQLL